MRRPCNDREQPSADKDGNAIRGGRAMASVLETTTVATGSTQSDADSPDSAGFDYD